MGSTYLDTYLLLSGDVHEATVMGLLPFTNYDCYVTAKLILVWERDLHPCTTLTQRTVESGECVFG